MPANIVELSVPEIRPVEIIPSLVELEKRITARSEKSRNFVSTFGLELKTATILAVDGSQRARELLQRLLSRPAFEPVLLQGLSDVIGPDVAPQRLVALASGLAGTQVHFSNARMRTEAAEDGSFTRYARDEQRKLWSRYIEQNEREDQPCVLAGALVTYILTIICHPLTDANGRLARALITGRLVRGKVMIGPVIPLGPAFYLCRATVAGALATLSHDGDWNKAVLALAEPIALACDLADGIERFCYDELSRLFNYCLIPHCMNPNPVVAILGDVR